MGLECIFVDLPVQKTVSASETELAFLPRKSVFAVTSLWNKERPTQALLGPSVAFKDGGILKA
jgi:hypothetical protein